MSLKKNQPKQKKKLSKRALPKFLSWLKRQIDSGDKRFALDSQDLVLYKPSHVDTKLIFLLPDVFEHYYNYSGVSMALIQSELKKLLMINFAYTIVRKDKVIEVFPCQIF